jgi:hypothetical protein
MADKIYYFFDENTKIYNGMQFCTDIQPQNSTDIEPVEYNKNLKNIKFENDEWVIIDKLISGEFYDKSNGSLSTQINAKEENNYTTKKPTLEINEGDEIAFISEEWVYVKIGVITQAKIDAENLQRAKDLKIKQIKQLYFQAQLTNLIDGCTIPVLLKGDFYLLLKDRVNTAEKYGIASVEFVDIHGNSYQAGANRITKELPFVFLNELFTFVNPYSENNRLICSEYAGDEDTGLKGKAQYCQNENAINNLNPQFIKCPDVDLDELADNLYSKTDEQLKALNDKYGNKNIALFRQWKENLTLNEQGKYVMFEKIN